MKSKKQLQAIHAKSKFSGKIPANFEVGKFVRHDDYGKKGTGHYGIITRVISDRADGSSRFFRCNLYTW